MTTLERLKTVRDIARKLQNSEDYSVLCDFITYFERRGTLSGRQERFFSSIEGRNTPELVKGSKAFLKTLQDPAVKPEIMAVCKYYSAGQYWRQKTIAKKLLGWYLREDLEAKGLDVDSVTMPLPSYSEFVSIFENKYAKKIRENVRAPRLWNIGDLVQIRKASAGEVREINAPKHGMIAGLRSYEGVHWGYGSSKTVEELATIPYLWDVPFTIIDITDEVGRPMNYNEKRGGTRYYKVLPLGRATVIKVMERDLKKVIKKRIS